MQPGMPGMPNLQNIILQAQQMQNEMQRAQESLADAEVTGTSGGGLVTAVVAGGGDLKSLRIDPSVVDPSDVPMLEDLVIAAVADARRQAEALASSTMNSVAGGLAGALDLSSLGLPGLGGIPGFGPPAPLGGPDDEYSDDDFDDEYDDEDDSDEDDSDGDDPQVDELNEDELDEGEILPGPDHGGRADHGRTGA